jgi:hypothetical protein
MPRAAISTPNLGRAEPNTIRALRERLRYATVGIPVKPRSTEREHALGDNR